jgi:hypothetical protein
MIRSAVALLVCLAVAVLLPGASRAGEIDQADQLLEQAAVLSERNDARDLRFQQLKAGLGEIPPGSKDVAEAEALSLVGKLATVSAAAVADEESAAGLLHAAAALDVNPELRIYLDQQQEISGLRLEYWTVRQEMASYLRALYRGWDRLTPAERSQLRLESDARAAAAGGLDGRIRARAEASEKYYAMKGLGGAPPPGADRRPPEEAAWKGYLLLALILGLGVATGVLAIRFAGRGLPVGADAGTSAKPSALGWCVLAFGLVPPLLMFFVGKAGADLLPWIWAAGLAVLIAGVGAVMKKDRRWPTWAGLVLGVPVALFWALFALGHLVGGGE